MQLKFPVFGTKFQKGSFRNRKAKVINMGLFDKKYCDICGEKIGFLGNRKLEDGNLCKTCARKLSPFFTERRRSTVEQIRDQLAYRSENAEMLKNFQPWVSYGTDEKIYFNRECTQMIVTSADDWASANPDIIALDRVISVETHIEDNKEEIFRKDRDGNEKSYNPPRYQYAYEFHITFRIDSPWFDEITVDLNNGQRPESTEDAGYLEWQMRMQEIVSVIRQKKFPSAAGTDPYGSDGTAQVRDDRQTTQSGSPAFGLETKPYSAQPLTADETWKCPACGAENKGKFCEECGTPQVTEK